MIAPETPIGDLNTPHVRLINVSKSYGTNRVLSDVSMEVLPGEVHILAGENGAGKSTLMKVLSGVVTDYEGTIEIGAKAVRMKSPLDAADRGIAVIHQELSLVPSMSIRDNLFLGDMPETGGWIQRRKLDDEARAALGRVGLDLPLDLAIEQLPIATQQLVEVAKALRPRNEEQPIRVVIMDEPTSALNIQEAERLFTLISELKSAGVGIVYISHKMDEIERLADRITVLRDGNWIATEPAAEMPVAKLISLMVGDRARNAGGAGLEDHSDASPRGQLALRASDIRVQIDRKAVVDGVDLELYRGEVVGIAGLEGSGNSNLLLGLFGAYGKIQGEVEIFGQPISIRNPAHAIRKGMALLTSDRKATGLVLPMSVAQNTTLAALPRLTKAGWRSDRREREVSERAKVDLSIRAASLDMPVGGLSGGNQQKVALAKWIETEPDILLLDEPTRGIDINAKREIYALIGEWKRKGMAIALITSELPELLGLADRIIVMHRGKIVTEFARSEATPERIVKAAMNA